MNATTGVVNVVATVVVVAIVAVATVVVVIENGLALVFSLLFAIIIVDAIAYVS